jgi:hypothetical protein
MNCRAVPAELYRALHAVRTGTERTCPALFDLGLPNRASLHLIRRTCPSPPKLFMPEATIRGRSKPALPHRTIEHQNKERRTCRTSYNPPWSAEYDLDPRSLPSPAAPQLTVGQPRTGAPRNVVASLPCYHRS